MSSGFEIRHKATGANSALRRSKLPLSSFNTLTLVFGTTFVSLFPQIKARRKYLRRW